MQKSFVWVGRPVYSYKLFIFSYLGVLGGVWLGVRWRLCVIFFGGIGQKDVVITGAGILGIESGGRMWG